MAVSGCGGGLATVSGTVTYKNKPLSNASIHFESGGATQSTKTKEDGTYLIKIPPGEAKVMIYAGNDEEARKFGDLLRPRDSKRTDKPAVPNPAAPRPGAGNMPKVGTNLSVIPERYGNFATSGLSKTIKSGRNKDVNFDLTD
jgi:hypothetical protein